MSLDCAASNGFRPPTKGEWKTRHGRLGLRMARTPLHRMAPKLSASAGALTALIAAAALLVPGAGVAGASTWPGGNFFLVTPGVTIPSQVPCGSVAEFASPHGFPFPVQEGGSIVSAFRLPGPQAQTFIADFKLLGSFLSWLAITTQGCGSQGSSGSGVVAE